MAIVYRAELVPTKQELLTSWLDRHDWGGRGTVEQLGSYRFDDPDGAVGVEGFIVARGPDLIHVPFTYRDSPLPDADTDAFVDQLSHSVLGPRWVYDLPADPVGAACLLRALRGEQLPAVWEIHHPDGSVEQTEPPVRVHRVADPAGSHAEVSDNRDTLSIARRLTPESALGSPRLVADWDGGSAQIAALS